MHGISTAVKPPNKPSKKISHKVFGISAFMIIVIPCLLPAFACANASLVLAKVAFICLRMVMLSAAVGMLVNCTSLDEAVSTGLAYTLNGMVVRNAMAKHAINVN